MKNPIAIILVAFFWGILLSCSKGNEPTEFDIVGQWGVTTVTYIDSDGTSDYFGQQGKSYYSLWTFQINGVLIVKSNPSGETRYGDYIYDVNKKKLNFLYEGDKRRINARVLVHNPTSMTVTEDLQEVGMIIYTMKKIAW